MVEQDKAMFGVSESQAYDDIHLCQLMLGNLNAAKAAGDFRALASMQKNRIKNNRTDTPDEPDLAFDTVCIGAEKFPQTAIYMGGLSCYHGR